MAQILQFPDREAEANEAFDIAIRKGIFSDCAYDYYAAWRYEFIGSNESQFTFRRDKTFIAIAR